MSAAVLAALAVAATPVDAALEVTPRAVPFGDPIEARATIAVDTRALDPDRVVVSMRPGPLTKLGERRRWSRSDRLAVLRVSVRLACRSEACVPTRGARRVQLPPLRVGNRNVEWPPLDVLPRVPAAAVGADEPPFVADVTLPEPSFRVDPDAADTLLVALAILLSAAAFALLALEARHALAARPRRAGTPLERALARVRASLRAGPGERRRAVGALARLLGPAEPRLARSAAELAWGEPQPETDDVEALAGRVEREVQRR
jgi:hypothetical protein